MKPINKYLVNRHITTADDNIHKLIKTWLTKKVGAEESDWDNTLEMNIISKLTVVDYNPSKSDLDEFVSYYNDNFAGIKNAQKCQGSIKYSNYIIIEYTCYDKIAGARVMFQIKYNKMDGTLKIIETCYNT